MKNLISSILLAGLLGSAVAYAEVAVVVGSGSGISSADTKELERLYLGKGKSLGGTAAKPLNQKGSSPVSEEFNKALLKKSNSQVKAYWSKLIFTGKGTPPVELADDTAVISAVNSDPSAVGYISAGSVTGDVKVLTKL